MFFNEIFMEASPYWFFFLFPSKHLVSAEVSQAGKKTLLQGFGKEVCEISGHRWMVQELSKAPDF